MEADSYPPLSTLILSPPFPSFVHDQIPSPQSLPTVPKEALSMIRYHSFYPWHKEGAYRHLMCEDDHEQLKAVKAFNRESFVPSPFSARRDEFVNWVGSAMAFGIWLMTMMIIMMMMMLIGTLLFFELCILSLRSLFKIRCTTKRGRVEAVLHGID